MNKEEKKLIRHYSEFKLILITVVLLYFVIFPLFLPANFILRYNQMFIVLMLILWLSAAIIYFISHHLKRSHNYLILQYATIITDIFFLSAILLAFSGINNNYFFLYAFIIIGAVFYLNTALVFTAGVVSASVIFAAFFLEIGISSSFNDYLLLIFRIIFIVLISYFVYIFTLGLKEILRQKRKIKKIASLNEKMLYNFSNELRAPLPVIRDFIELLLTKKIGPLNSKQRHILELLHENTSDLIEDSSTIIYFNQLEQNEFNVRKRENDLINILKGVIRRTATDASIAGVRLNFSSHHKNIPVAADKSKISNALYLVLAKAIKAARKNTRMTIKCQRSSYSDFISINYEYYGARLPEAVTDKYSQLDLYVAKKIIKRHGGDIFLVEKGKERQKISIIISAVE